MTSRLASEFENRTPDDHGEGWSKLWNEGYVPWDRGQASPALVDLLEGKADMLNGFNADGSRKKALVPGCGRGYDVILLALHGYDAYGLDLAPKAVEEAKQLAAKDLSNPPPEYFGGKYNKPSGGIGSVTFIEGDFFTNTWQGVAASQFDLIYDYTFLCALHPSMRINWSNRMAELVRPKAFLACLEFPTYKDPSIQGPPWGVNGAHWNMLTLGGNGIVDGSGDEPPGDGGKFVRLVHYKAPRTHEMGKDTDKVSVYQRK